MNYTTIGIDVSKAKLDIFFDSTGEWMTITNSLQGFNKFLHQLEEQKLSIERIIVEHTGAYQKELVAFLHIHSLPVCLVHPVKVRNFAKAIGRLAKTDKLDAQILAEYGRIMQPELSVCNVSKNEHLRELVKYRRQLTDNLVLTKQWIEKKPAEEIKQRIQSIVNLLHSQIDAIEKEILDTIKSDTELYQQFKILTKTKGVAERTASILLSELPELGKVSRNKIVALCGLAPMNRDSGTMRGKACIQGGRKTVRNALYMSIISSIKANNVIHNYYQNLKENGKPSRVAMVACMRKLIIHLNQNLKSFSMN